LLEQLEQEIEQLQETVNDPAFFAKPVDETQPSLDSLSAKEQELDVAFERWDELEALQQER
jgi:ATP-binding cassette subfamily F protein uup